MPNHITNILEVTGPEEALIKFRTAVEKKDEKDDFDFDFNGTVPMPEEIKNTSSGPSLDRLSEEERMRQLSNREKFGALDWYEWAVRYWGTKWGAYDCKEPSQIDGGIQYRFNTAWSPGIPWLETTSKMYPTLHFKCAWHDEGGGSGLIEIEDQSGMYEDTELTDHEWLFNYNPDYRDEYFFITEGNYNEVIKRYAEVGYSDYSSFNPYLLNRIKDQDLPLFINYEWYGKQHEEFEKRISEMKNIRKATTLSKKAK